MSETTAEDLSWLAEWCERIRRAVANAGDRETVRKAARIAASLRADLEAAEERAQKAETQAVVADGQAGARAEKLTIMSRVLAAAEARVKELEEALGGQHTTRIVEDAMVRVLEEEGARWREKWISSTGGATDRYRGACIALAQLADRIKAGKA